MCDNTAHVGDLGTVEGRERGEASRRDGGVRSALALGRAGGHHLGSSFCHATDFVTSGKLLTFLDQFPPL